MHKRLSFQCFLDALSVMRYDNKVRQNKIMLEFLQKKGSKS